MVGGQRGGVVTVLSEWRRRLAEMSDCPWPGARPITLQKDGIDALHLRDPDIRSVVGAIDGSDVIVLTGESGVGKSSLLSVGVVPQLEQRGYLVIRCDDWSSVDRGSEPADGRRLVLAAVVRQLPFAPEDPSFTGVLRELDQRYPGQTVIVLDQFEELLRYDPAVAREVMDWVQEVIASSSTRVLLSLRSEYGFHVLGGLRLGAGRLRHVQVNALTDHAIALAIVTRGKPRDEYEAFISRSAVRAITTAWKLASHYDVGLLHLQALMWSAWMERTGDGIELRDVRKVLRPVRDKTEAGEAFSEALARSVQIALDQCRDAGDRADGSETRTVDAVLESRAAGSIAGMILHLSNDGYKRNRERETLARLALFTADHDEWESALDGAEDALTKLKGRVDGEDDEWLSASRSEFLDPPASTWPWELDPREQTAGPLLGARPEDAVVESFRAFYFGLEWLRQCSIIRMSRTPDSKMMVSLVHDGFADGLNRWRRSQRLELAELTTRLVATKGKEFSWPPRPKQSPAGRIIHSNLRIQHSEITGRIVDTTFVNCDFRGTLFQNCTFDGVTFVNCFLDDVQFTGCPIVGTPAGLEAAETGKLPGYVVDATPPHIRSIAWYRGMTPSAFSLHSATAGLPALPVETVDHGTATLIPSRGGGLAILGGRISSLKFRHCEFFDEGGILMSQAAGTSVEFADQAQLRLRGDGVTLRAITFTTPLEELVPLEAPVTSGRRRAKRDAQTFALEFEDALLSNIWFSQSMRGRVNFVNCLIWQMFNAGDGDLAIDFDEESGFVGLVNVDVGPRVPLADPSKDGIGAAMGRVTFARERIDYRSHPTVLETEELTGTIRSVSPSFFPAEPDSTGVKYPPSAH